jgi:rhodanese-related sulfurtransferase
MSGKRRRNRSNAAVGGGGDLVREISVEQLAERLRSNDRVVLLDVRQQWEYETAKLANSILLPLPELASRASEIEVPSGAALIVYCHHGIRSRSAAELLERLGFKEVYSVAGGIDAWSSRIDPGVPLY